MPEYKGSLPSYLISVVNNFHEFREDLEHRKTAQYLSLLYILHAAHTTHIHSLKHVLVIPLHSISLGRSLVAVLVVLEGSPIQARTGSIHR